MHENYNTVLLVSESICFFRLCVSNRIANEDVISRQAMGLIDLSDLKAHSGTCVSEPNEN